MLPLKVIASDIQNLTDARYFAAYGVDFLAFGIDENADNYLPTAQIKEIIEWVEGPSNIAIFSGLSVSDQAMQQMREIDFNACVLSPFLDQSSIGPFDGMVLRECTLTDLKDANTPVILKLEKEVNQLSNEEWSEITSFAENNLVYLDGNFTTADLEKVLTVPQLGIVVRGGEEEKVGFKSYDELDEIFDFLLDYEA